MALKQMPQPPCWKPKLWGALSAEAIIFEGVQPETI